MIEVRNGEIDQAYAKAEIDLLTRKAKVWSAVEILLVFVCIGILCTAPAAIIAAYRWAL